MTSADAIRNMTDDELCVFIRRIYLAGKRGNGFDFCDYNLETWISQENADRNSSEIPTGSTISKMEQVEDKPQTECNGCKFVGTYDTEFPCANCSRKTKDYYAKDEPQTTDYCDVCNHKGCDNCVADGSNPYCVPSNYEPKDESQSLEQFRVGLEYHTDTTHFGKTKGESIATNKFEDEPQTDCPWK